MHVAAVTIIIVALNILTKVSDWSRIQLSDPSRCLVNFVHRLTAEIPQFLKFRRWALPPLLILSKKIEQLMN